jgi:hypothetical protein
VRQNYLGLNNLKVGRIAAHMIATASHHAGKIAVFVGGYRWHGHELRETGVRSYFREYAPQFQILDTLINLETRQLTYEATLDLLGRHPDLRGIYCAGGGMEGAIAAVREARAPGEVALVVNELTPESRAALIGRHVTMVIGTPLPRLCDDLVRLATEAVSDGCPRCRASISCNPTCIFPKASDEKHSRCCATSSGMMVSPRDRLTRGTGSGWSGQRNCRGWGGPGMIHFALNHMTVARLSFRELVALSRQLGCVGIEVRNDLPQPLFDGMDPAEAGAHVRGPGCACWRWRR